MKKYYCDACGTEQDKLEVLSIRKHVWDHVRGNMHVHVKKDKMETFIQFLV